GDQSERREAEPANLGQYKRLSEPRQPLEEPERGECADGIGRRVQDAALDTNADRGPPRAAQDGEYRSHEREVPACDANAEGGERERDVALWKADVRERAREAEPVQQPERERHEPWPARRESDDAALAVDDLGREEEDAQRDRGLHWGAGHVDDAQGR